MSRLIVETPPGFEAERRYIAEVVLGEWLGLEWELRPGPGADVRIRMAGDAAARAVAVPDVLFGGERAAWLTPASLPHAPLRWLPAGDRGERLPVIYGPDPPAAVLLGDDGRLGVDVFGSAFFMLTRYEELVVQTRDEHGRFPAAASLAHSAGFLGIPIVDAYVELLWEALRTTWPGLQRRPRRFEVVLSHDVDRPLSFLGQGARGRARQLAKDAIVARDAGLAARRIRSWAGIRRGDHRLDPDNTFGLIMDVSERCGLVSAFNFLATEEVGFIDGFYTLEHPWIRSLMSAIHRRGHEIGYHGGFQTYRDADRTASEFRRLLAAAGQLGIEQESWGGRQHYLRWEAPVTWLNWEAAGLRYDSTLGHAECAGFRAGTCHDYPVFDLRSRRPLRLRERPLIVMDVTLDTWMELTPDAATRTVLELAATCRRHQGTFTFLCHNSELQSAKRQSWYVGLVEALTSVR